MSYLYELKQGYIIVNSPKKSYWDLPQGATLNQGENGLFLGDRLVRPP